MKTFKQWLEEMTSTASVATVPMRMLSDQGRPYIGIPGRPSPYDKEGKPTVVRRSFPRDENGLAKLPHKWAKDLYDQETQIIVGDKK